MITLGIVLGLVVAMIGLLWYVIAREPGPSVADVAVAYELALDRGDWSTVFDLSGVELRGEFDRDHFVASRDARSPREHRAATSTHVEVERETVSSDSAIVFTMVDTPEGTRRNALQCERRLTRWVVTGYAPVAS
jgi:hypothetical protein